MVLEREIIMLRYRIMVLEHIVSTISPKLGLTTQDLEEIQQEIIEKLRKEYPEWFKEKDNV